jgi:hypothetical protein
MAWTGLMISLSIITDHVFTHLHAQSAQFFFSRHIHSCPFGKLFRVLGFCIIPCMYTGRTSGERMAYILGRQIRT